MSPQLRPLHSSAALAAALALALAAAHAVSPPSPPSAPFTSQTAGPTSPPLPAVPTCVAAVAAGATVAALSPGVATMLGRGRLRRRVPSDALHTGDRLTVRDQRAGAEILPP